MNRKLPNQLLLRQKQFQMTSFLMILYHITNLLYGVIVYSLGPIVPYLAEETGLTEGHFTYLFIIKGITFMSTCLLKVTILKDHSNLHQAMWIGCLLSGIGTFIFTATRETSLMIIAMIIMSIGVCIIDIYIGVCILAEGKDDPRSHLSISFGLQSLGSVIGPVLVSIMGIPSLYISALLISLCFIAFISKNDPIRQQETEYGEKIKFLTPKLRYYLCGIMLFYAVLQLSYKTWFPSFCIMMGYLEKSAAALTVSLYTTIQIVCRLFLSLQTMFALKMGINGSVLLTVGAIFAYFFNLSYLIVYGTTILFAFLLSLHYPYMFAVPSHYRMGLSLHDTSSLLISYAIGQAVLTSMIGYLMDYIDPMSLFYYIFFIGICRKICFEKMTVAFQEEHNTPSEELLEKQLVQMRSSQ